MTQEDLLNEVEALPDVSPALVMLARDFVVSRPDSLATATLHQDYRWHPIRGCVFWFRWPEMSICFERDKATLFTGPEGGEGYGWDVIDADFLDYFDELAEKRAQPDYFSPYTQPTIQGDS